MYRVFLCVICVVYVGAFMFHEHKSYKRWASEARETFTSRDTTICRIEELESLDDPTLALHIRHMKGLAKLHTETYRMYVGFIPSWVRWFYL